MRAAIVGANAAGATAAARLRRLRPDWDILLLERGEYVSYANCGLVYHIEGLVPDRSRLFVESAATLRDKYRLDLRLSREVVGIDRLERRLRVLDRATGSESLERYDLLLLATGSEPILPDIPGTSSESVMAMWTIGDMDRILRRVSGGAGAATIVGAGYLGCQLAEALRERGMNVALVEERGRVLSQLDPDIASYGQAEIESRGVSLYLGEGVDRFEPDPAGGIGVSLASGTRIRSSFAVLCAGRRPNSRLAAEAGLEIGETGGIAVGESLRSSDPDIYAAGDVAEATHAVTGAKVNSALAGPAHNQGRIAAENMAGLSPGWAKRYSGSLGSSILRLWNTTLGSTGASSAQLERAGIPFRSVFIHAPDRASYYPGSSELHLKLLFAPDGLVLGAQAAGGDGVSKRLDVIATAMHFGARVSDLEELQLGYSPPFGTPRDPVNIAGSAARGIKT
jgi:NADPH-dependent 2,4-dienoyl-CoA reductase/sulfur reductase-like enzyme